MYARIKNNQVTGVISSPNREDSLLVVVDEKPSYDNRYQFLVAPASVANAPDKYVINDGYVSRIWTAEDVPVLNMQQRKLLELSNYRKTDVMLAVIYTVNGIDYLLHADDMTINAISTLQARLALDDINLTRTWYFDDGKTIAITNAQAIDIMSLVVDHGQHLLDIAAIHEIAIMALTTQLDVINYDITVGW